MRARTVAGCVLVCALGCASVGPHTERARPTGPIAVGWRLLARGDARAACSAFETAVAQDPHDLRAYRGLASCHYLLGEYSRELDARRLLLAIEPGSAPDWTSLGHLLLATDDLEGAREAYRRALALDPQDDAARFNLGLIDQELGCQPSSAPPAGYLGDVPRYRDRRDSRLWLNGLR